MSIKKIDLNVSNKIYLIEKAIQFRAKECFDLLLETDIKIIHGLKMSIRLLEDPNQSNRYYFDKIIEKLGDVTNINFDQYSKTKNLYKILLENIISSNTKIDYRTIINYKKKEDFLILLDKYCEQSESCLLMLITYCIQQSNGFANLVYDKLEQIKPNYYSDKETIKLSNSIILETAFCSNDMNIITLIMSKPIRWTQINEIPSLYLTINKNSETNFNIKLYNFILKHIIMYYFVSICMI